MVAMTLKIALGSDHGGFSLKEILKQHIQAQYPAYVAIDCGTHSEQSVDYPDCADNVVTMIIQKEADVGILVCGTGIGISIRANRYKGIRAAVVCSNTMAQMAKAHNNANILCLGGRTATQEEAKGYVDTWLTTAFEGGRHQPRLDKLDRI